MKKAISIFIIFFALGLNAQSNDSVFKKTEPRNVIKGNLLFAPIGIVNIGYEHVFNNNWTGQADILISPWKSFDNRHLQAYMGFVEARYYFSKALEKWYIGGNFGMSAFNLTKWNYWKKNDKYQKGFNYMIGATVGYQFKLNDHWNLDLYVGGGTSQSFYHGWKKNVYPRERYDSARRWNKSGEFIPFRGGLMLSYKF